MHGSAPTPTPTAQPTHLLDEVRGQTSDGVDDQLLLLGVAHFACDTRFLDETLAVLGVRLGSSDGGWCHGASR